MSAKSRSLAKSAGISKESTQKTGAQIIVDTLISHGIRCITVAQKMDSARSHDHLATQVTLSLFEQLAQMERDLISRRTKQGLAKAVAKGKRLGRPKGSGKSKLDAKVYNEKHSPTSTLPH